MAKKITLFLCMVFLLTLVACKQDATQGGQQNNNSALSETVDNNQQNTISGIELEEDVFDDSDVKTPAQSNQANGTSSKEDSSTGSTTESTESNSKKEDGADNSLSNDDSNTDETEDLSSDNNSSNTSSEDVTVEDGVVKLPIDKFD